MCKSSSKPIGRFLPVLLLVLCCSSPAWSQAASQPTSAAPAGSSAFSLDGSIKALSNLMSTMPTLPSKAQMLPIDSSLPIAEQRRLQLINWDNLWAKQEEWNKVFLVWISKVKVSSTLISDSNEKEQQSQTAALNAKDLLSAAKDAIIQDLRAELAKGDFAKVLFGGGGLLIGAVTGYAAGHATK